MAIALKNIKDALYPGALDPKRVGELYPGWKITKDFTTDSVWVEGPEGYVSNIPRKALDDAGCGLDGVMEFIIQKDARMKREASLQVPLYEQVRVQAQKQAERNTNTATEQALEKAREEWMCAKGYGAVPVNPEIMKTAAAYQTYLGLARLSPREAKTEMIARMAEAGMSRAEMQKFLYEPTVEVEPQNETGPAEPVHKPWNGVREVDLD